MLDWLRRLTEQSRNLRELATLDERAFADMGVSREQALNLAAMPEVVIDRVQAMGQVFGHEATALAHDRAEWVQMIETCAQCRNVPQCQRFLRQDGHPSPAGAGFCPNRELFAERSAKHQPQAA